MPPPTRKTNMTNTYEVSFTATSNYWMRVEAPDAETAEDLVEGFSPDINWDGANLLEIIEPEVTETVEV
jgi:hypothetical protein